MSWTLKILADGFNNINLHWNGVNFIKEEGSTKDYVINHHRNSTSTWREVGYELNKRTIKTNTQTLTETFYLTSKDATYQFLEPLLEEVDVILPLKPKQHIKYLIKNTSLQKNKKINIRASIDKEPIVVLQAPNNIVQLYFDSVNYQIEI